MADDRHVLREIDWQELIPGLILLRSFRLAREFPKLVLAATALLLTAAGWSLLGYVFSGDPAVAATIERHRGWPWEAAASPESTSELRVAGTWLVSQLGLESQLGSRDVAWLARNPMVECWLELSRPFRQMFSGDLNISGFVYLFTCGLWAATVWGLFGGAITRIAAVQLARQERLSARKAIDYSKSRWAAYTQAPLTPLILMGMMVLFTALFGWLLRFDVGVVMAALLWPVLLVFGFVSAVVALGLMFGWPLMSSTISVEGTDSFDAISRSYSYLFQRPLHTALYAAVATIYGIFCWLLVSAFAAGVVHLTLWSAGWSAGGERIQSLVAHLPATVAMTGLSDATTIAPAGELPALSSPGRLGVMLLAGWIGLVKLLALGFAYSYFWTATTAIYYVLRLHVDHAELDEVYLDPQDEAFTLPELAKDDAGVPVVVEEASTASATSHA